MLRNWHPRGVAQRYCSPVAAPTGRESQAAVRVPSAQRRDYGRGEFLRRVGPARRERRPTIRKLRELLVGRRGEAPLVPPYILPSFKKALALFCGRVASRRRRPEDHGFTVAEFHQRFNPCTTTSSATTSEQCQQTGDDYASERRVIRDSSRKGGRGGDDGSGPVLGRCARGFGESVSRVG